MKNLFRRLSCGILATAVAVITALPVSANSYQTSWSGITPSGTFITDGESPIAVEKELLTFDIPTFTQHFHTLEEYLDYPAKVTAEYTFYNPSDNTIQVKLLFPFGAEPSYITFAEEDGVVAHDTDKFDILLNGEKTDKTIRHTYITYSRGFDAELDLALLQDSFREDDFYKPDLPVTKYTYHAVYDAEKFELEDEIPNPTIGFDLPKSDGLSRFYQSVPGAEIIQEDETCRITHWLNEDAEEETVLLYCFGKAPETPPEWTLYLDGNTEQEMSDCGTVQLENTEEMSFRDFIMTEYSDYPENSAVSEIDWYNAVLTEIECGVFDADYGYVKVEYPSEDFTKQLMRWYEYEITFAPQERIVNTVTAPIYPGFDTDYTSPIYTYSYLLSPAKSWTSFGDFNLEIHTPYYLLESSIENLTKTDYGYSYEQDGLPDGEFTFKLSESSSPEYSPKYQGGGDGTGKLDNSTASDIEGMLWTIVLIAGGLLGLVLAIAIPVVIIILIVKLAKRSKKTK